MRAIFLNCWFARAGERFYNFIREYSSTTDFFSLVEVSPEMFSKLGIILSEFEGHYEQGIFADREMRIVYGQAFFTKKGIDMQPFKKIETYKVVNGDPCFLVPYCLEVAGKALNIMSVHGKAKPGHKLDTPARIRQSKIIINYLQDKKGPKIVGGDFNLEFQTKSIKMFEEAGYKNLVKEFNIKNTRNRLTWEQFPGEGKQYFADYIFVSPEVRVKNFEVPNVEISDHLPLILDFEV